MPGCARIKAGDNTGDFRPSIIGAVGDVDCQRRSIVDSVHGKYQVARIDDSRFAHPG